MCSSEKKLCVPPLYYGNQRELVDSMIYEAIISPNPFYESGGNTIEYFCETLLRQNQIYRVLSSEKELHGVVYISCLIDERGKANGMRISKKLTTSNDEGIALAYNIIDSITFIHPHDYFMPVHVDSSEMNKVTSCLYGFCFDFDLICNRNIDYHIEAPSINFEDITETDSIMIKNLLGIGTHEQFLREEIRIRKIDEKIYSYYQENCHKAVKLYAKASKMNSLPCWIRVLFASYLPETIRNSIFAEIGNDVTKQPKIEQVLFFKELEIIDKFWQ